MPAELAQDRTSTGGRESGISGSIKRHPVTAFFIMAFLGTWLMSLVVLMSPRGIGLINLPDGLVLAMFFLGVYAGPFLAAWITNRVVDGPDGLRRWFRRMLQWRVGWVWYLLVLIGYPIAFAVPAMVMAGQSAVSAAQQNAGSFVLGYVATIMIGFFVPTLGEEAGWRGFALARLQGSRGPLLGTLILGVLHALWHVPAYFIKGPITETGIFDPVMFAANSLAIIATSFIWTWLFNHTAGSILFATLVHAASNGMSANLPAFLDLQDSNVWFAFGVSGVIAILVIVLTRGRLGYSEQQTV